MLGMAVTLKALEVNFDKFDKESISMNVISTDYYVLISTVFAVNSVHQSKSRGIIYPPWQTDAHGEAQKSSRRSRGARLERYRLLWGLVSIPMSVMIWYGKEKRLMYPRWNWKLSLYSIT